MKVRTTIIIEEELLIKLKIWAIREKTTISKLLEKIIREYLKEK